MSTMWKDIASQCKPIALSEPFINVYVTDDLGQPWHWLIGKYRDLRSVAKQLRTNKKLCDELWDNGVRFGFRTSGKNPTDVPPLGRKRQKAYGDMKQRAVTADFSKKRGIPVLQPVRPAPSPSHRISDEFSNVDTYWETQTPQAHHIVEFDNLESLGLSTRGTGDLDYYGLPCVLLMAEFHQRYISSVLKHLHGFNGKTLSPEKKTAALKNLEGAYKALYDQSAHGKEEAFPFRSLWYISETIFGEARGKVTKK
jgi:hypothetical protein